MSAIWNLFYIFFKIGLLSIGGGYAIIPLIQEQVVEQSKWLSLNAFTDMITISQMTPGPLAVNISTFAGLQIGGIPGAIAATLGCILAGVMISLALYHLFQRCQSSSYAFEILNGLKAASLGLIISAAATLLLLAFFPASAPLSFSTLDWFSLGTFATALFCLRKWKVNPILIMIISGVVGLFLY